jgi:hypothetical protein
MALFGLPESRSATGGLFGLPESPTGLLDGLLGLPESPTATGGLFGRPRPPAATGGLFGRPRPPAATNTVFSFFFGEPELPEPEPPVRGFLGGFNTPAPPPVPQFSGFFGAPAPPPVPELAPADVQFAVPFDVSVDVPVAVPVGPAPAVRPTEAAGAQTAAGRDWPTNEVPTNEEQVRRAAAEHRSANPHPFQGGADSRELPLPEPSLAGELRWTLLTDRDLLARAGEGRRATVELARTKAELEWHKAELEQTELANAELVHANDLLNLANAEITKAAEAFMEVAQKELARVKKELARTKEEFESAVPGWRAFWPETEAECL